MEYTNWYVAQKALIRIQYEGLDNQRPKHANPVRRHRSTEYHACPQPRLRITERLTELRMSPFARHDTHLIIVQPLNGDYFVGERKECSFVWGVRHVEEHDDCKKHGEDAEE